MRKLLIAGMMGTAAMIGCGDDEGGEDAGTNGTTSGTSGGTGDGGTTGDVTYETQVENTGDECSGDGDCMGPTAECFTEIEIPDTSGIPGAGGGDDAGMDDGGTDMDASTGPELPESIPYEGGYCSAACSNDMECGEGGGCVGSALVDAVSGFLGDFDLTSFGIMLNCGVICTDVSDCREGYQCATAAAALGAGMGGGGGGGGIDLSAIEGLLGNLPTYCLPETPMVEEDGGTGDGGETDGGTEDGGDTDGGDTDGGDTDGGDTDGGDTDAGDTDAGDTDAG